MNNKGADQSVRMYRMVCTFVACNPEDRFSGVEVHMFVTCFYFALLQYFSQFIAETLVFLTIEETQPIYIF